jgi:hypothetical protein
MGHQELQESHQEPSGAIRSNALNHRSHQGPSGAIRSNALKAHT